MSYEDDERTAVESQNLPDVGSTDFSDWQEAERFGPWPRGWAKMKFLSRYTTRATEQNPSGVTFETEDVVSQKLDSRNIRIATEVTNKAGETRNILFQLNYVPDDLTAARRAQVAEAQKAAQEGNGGRLPKKWGGAGIQRAAIFYGRIKHLQTVNGAPFTRNGAGAFELDTLVGKEAWAYITTEARNGREYNRIDDVATAAPERGVQI